MLERSLRRRIAGVTTVLVTVGVIFAPVAPSYGDPGGGNGGQGNGGQGNGSQGASGSSQGNGSQNVPPGQAKKQAGGQGESGQQSGSSDHSSASSISQQQSYTSRQSASSNSSSYSYSSQTGDDGNPSAPGQIKKAAASTTSASTTSSVPPGQAKKQARAVTTVATTAVAATPTPAPPAAPAPTPVASAPAATPVASAPASTPTRTPARSRGAKHPNARRSSAQRRSSHRRASAGHRATAGRSSAAGRRTTRRSGAGFRTTARALARLSAAGSAAAAVAGKTTHPASHRGARTLARPTGHGQNAGPISKLIGTLIPVPLPVPDWSKPIILALLVICLLLAVRAWMTSRRARRIDSQRRRLAADLESLQPALVPEIPASFGPLAVSVAYRPADGPAAGGDFYDVFPVAGGRVAMMVGDVSGHGRAALTRAAHMRYMLRAYLETGLDPRSALKLAGRVLGADDEALFTTVAVAVYDRSASTMTYATAGHPPPIMLGPAAHRPLSIASPALGWGEPTGRRQTTIPFAEGARACLFSDGVTELRIRDGLLGRSELVDEVEHSDSASELLERVQRRAKVIRDDMAACIVEARAGTAISDVRIDELEVEMRHLDAGQGQRFLAECGVSAENANSTLAHARLIAAESGSALLRVEMTGDSAAASAGGSAPVSLTTPQGMAPAGSWASERSALS